MNLKESTFNIIKVNRSGEIYIDDLDDLSFDNEYLKDTVFSKKGTY
jgi:hypothetical protein